MRLLLPTTYMNESGKSVRALAHFLRFPRNKFSLSMMNSICPRARFDSSRAVVLRVIMVCVTLPSVSVVTRILIVYVSVLVTPVKNPMSLAMSWAQ